MKQLTMGLNTYLKVSKVSIGVRSFISLLQVLFNSHKTLLTSCKTLLPVLFTQNVAQIVLFHNLTKQFLFMFVLTNHVFSITEYDLKNGKMPCQQEY